MATDKLGILQLDWWHKVRVICQTLALEWQLKQRRREPLRIVSVQPLRESKSLFKGRCDCFLDTRWLPPLPLLVSRTENIASFLRGHWFCLNEHVSFVMLRLGNVWAILSQRIDHFETVYGSIGRCQSRVIQKQFHKPVISYKVQLEAPYSIYGSFVIHRPFQLSYNFFVPDKWIYGNLCYPSLARSSEFVG